MTKLMSNASQSSTSLGSGFWRLFSASGLTNLGDGLRLTALPLLALQSTSDPALISGVTAASMAPWLLFSLPFGVVVDRIDRKRAMVVGNLMRALCAGALAVAISLGEATIGTIFAAAIVLGVAEVLVDTASQAIVPAIVSSDMYERANGRLQTADMLGNSFIGPALGGVLFGVAAVLPFLASLPILLIAAILVWSLRGSYRAAPDECRRGLKSEFVEGIAWLWSRQLFRTLAILAGVANFFLSAVTALLVIVATERLNLGPFGFSALLMMLAAGSTIGGIMVEYVAGLIHLSRMIVVGILVFAASLLAIGVSTSWAVTGIALFFMGNAVMMLNVVTVTLRQSAVPAALLGRVVSVYRTFALGSVPIGAAVSGIVARQWGYPTPFVIGAISMVGLATIVSRTVTREAVDAARNGREDAPTTPGNLRTRPTTVDEPKRRNNGGNSDACKQSGN